MTNESSGTSETGNECAAVTEPATVDLPVLEYLGRMLDGTLGPQHRTHMKYPTAISRTLGFDLIAVGEGTATISTDVSTDRFANQQGTIHGGFLTELADATIGTACSTLIRRGDSFTSINLSATFIRPFWNGALIARAYSTHTGRAMSHWYCEVVHAEDEKTIMTATSTIMTLTGDRAVGR